MNVSALQEAIAEKFSFPLRSSSAAGILMGAGNLWPEFPYYPSTARAGFIFFQRYCHLLDSFFPTKGKKLKINYPTLRRDRPDFRLWVLEGARWRCFR
ncbi:MAG: hypothetical protein JW748_13335 [Anaerolineales bacterium]|nr:hypothetical protein [Anaerolineales bacterium]